MANNMQNMTLREAASIHHRKGSDQGNHSCPNATDGQWLRVTKHAQGGVEEVKMAPALAKSQVSSFLPPKIRGQDGLWKVLSRALKYQIQLTEVYI